MFVRKFIAVACLFLSILPDAMAQSWRDQMLLLKYAPRYFGPSAFPIPDLKQGRVPSKYEVEGRYEYHYYTGDQTKDIFLKAVLPVVRGKAGFEVSYIPWETYVMTAETVKERNAWSMSKGNTKYNGDVVLSAMFQILKSERWIDALTSFGIKTASGGRLSDARFTDAATYWADMQVGRNIAVSRDPDYYLRLYASSGFYCWMTNDMVHRQNDAWLYGAGISAGLGRVLVGTDISGFNGYEYEGDRPLVWRSCLQVDIFDNVISLRYNHGIYDFLYDTYSLALIRRF